MLVFRLITILIPLTVTIPLAFFLNDYRALILGSIATHLFGSITLMIKSPWQPRIFYDFRILRKMIKMSALLLLHSFLVWFTVQATVFIISMNLSVNELGYYKVSLTTVNQFMTLISAATLPVAFSALSRVKDDLVQFESIVLKFQKNVGFILIPMGFGMFVYREPLTLIFLGNQWLAASGFIGAMALITGIKTVLSNYCAEVFRALGKPQLLILVQVVFVIMLLPAIYLSSLHSFRAFYLTKVVMTVILVQINLIVMKNFTKLSPFKMLTTCLPFVISSIIMGASSYALLQVSHNVIWQGFTVLISILIYLITLVKLFPEKKELVRGLLKKFKSTL